MLKTTLSSVVCPACKGELRFSEGTVFQSLSAREGGAKVTREDAYQDALWGDLVCGACSLQFPILAGVAILVEDVESYLFQHIKGISKRVPDAKIPTRYQDLFREAKEALQEYEGEHIEEDLESERVNALYLMTHYLNASQVISATKLTDPLIHSLISQHWDHGPFQKIKEWMQSSQQMGRAVELGCGVGGLASVLGNLVESYLGVDYAFASIALAREIQLGVSGAASTYSIPGDLIDGPLAKSVQFNVSQFGMKDFVVGDFQQPPLKEASWDLSIALNAIDMMDDPRMLAQLQFALLKKDGQAIQSCPYIWHEKVATLLRKQFGEKSVGGSVDRLSSSAVVEKLYQSQGFSIQKKIDHLPWLFFKHNRQLEVYSVHLFLAEK